MYLTNERTAVFQPDGDTATVQHIANQQALDLLNQPHTRDDVAGATNYRAVQYDLSGGGPASDITFTLDDDGEVREAWFTYYDNGNTAAVYLNRPNATSVWVKLNADPSDEW